MNDEMNGLFYTFQLLPEIRKIGPFTGFYHSFGIIEFSTSSLLHLL